MNPLPRGLFVCSLLFAALSLRAQEQADPPQDSLADLTQKIGAGGKARAEAGKSLETFVLEPDANGKSFVKPDADHAALGEVVKAWAEKTDADSVAVLVFVTTPHSKPAGRLRAALSSWTGDGAVGSQEAAAGVQAFLTDAVDKARKLMADPRTRKDVEAMLAGSDQNDPRAKEAIERARGVSSRRNGVNFGPSREPGSLDPAGGRNPGSTGVTGQGGKALTTAGGGVAGTVGGGVTPTTEEQAIAAANQAKLLPSANLPANFRRKSVSEVPAPGQAAVVPPVQGTAVTAVGGTGATGVAGATGQTETPADDGSKKIEAVFHETVARLVREGKRGAGKGTANGVMNNARAVWDSKRLRCYDQAEELQGDLEKKVGSGKNGWTYKMTTYTGEGHEANGHWWINAVNKNPKVKTMLLDPWSGEIKYDDSKEPVVIKGYFGWYFGAVMDKIMN